MRRISRRQFSRVTLGVVAASAAGLVTGCDQPSPTGPTAVSPDAPGASTALGAESEQSSSATASDRVGPSSVTGSNRIEGTVTYASNGKYGRAAGARVEIFVNGTNTIVSRVTTGTRGEYTAFAGQGQFIARATYVLNGKTLTGVSNVVWFQSSAGGRARGINILVT
jgi:hypothetical protein